MAPKQMRSPAWPCNTCEQSPAAMSPCLSSIPVIEPCIPDQSPPAGYCGILQSLYSMNYVQIVSSLPTAHKMKQHH